MDIPGIATAARSHRILILGMLTLLLAAGCGGGGSDGSGPIGPSPLPVTATVSMGPGGGVQSFIVSLDYDQAFLAFDGTATPVGVAAGFNCITDDDGDVVASVCLGTVAVDGPGEIMAFEFTSSAGAPSAADFVLTCEFADAGDVVIPGIAYSLSLE